MNLPSIIPQTPQSTLTHKQLIGAFLSGRSEKTIQAYRQDLEDFRAFLKASSIDEAARSLLSCVHGQANALALAYKTSLIERGLQAATVNRRLASLRSLVKLARTLGIIPWALEVENMRSQSYRDTKGPGKEGYRSLLNQAKGAKKEPKAARDTAILHLLYDMGLRRGEVVGLDLTDLDLTGGTLMILGKGHTQKDALTLPTETGAVILSWIHVRGEDPGPLFTNLDPARQGTGRLTGTGLYKLVRGLGEKAGIKARPHGLRHSAITQALDITGGNVRAVAKFSRHASIQTLTRYDDNRLDLGGNVAQMVASSASV